MRSVLVTQRVDVLRDRNERRDALDQRWSDFLHKCGYLALPVPNRADVALAIAERADAAGVVFSGGNDLAAYGGDAPERDFTEEALMDWARTRAVPIIGVCRGLQMILHHFGVSLHRVDGHAGTRHDVEFDGSRIQVNSYHGWGASSCVPELAMRATCPDGLIEAVSHRDRPVMGIMWHPERDADPNPNDVALFRSIFEGHS